MKKKGALELSVTAIVVLILAIVMLGLGLGFVRGMFGKVSNTFDEQIAAEPAPAQPSATDIITLSRETIIASPGAKEAIKVAVFNPTGGALTITPYSNNTVSCTALNSAASAYSKQIAGGSSAEYNLLLDIKTNTGTTLCQVLASVGTMTYTKDFTITVR